MQRLLPHGRGVKQHLVGSQSVTDGDLSNATMDATVGNMRFSEGRLRPRFHNLQAMAIPFGITLCGLL